VRVHLAGKHALELEARDIALESAHVLLHGLHHALVRFDLGQLEEFARLGQTRAQPVERPDYGLELGALASQLLGALRLAPDRGILELAQDFGKALAACLVVKDTP
jgi:hypothetical protein